MVGSYSVCVVLLLSFWASFVLLTGSPRHLQIFLLPEFDDVIFDTLDLEELSAPSLFRCLVVCSQDARCVSVFYQESRGQCRLQGGRFYLAQGGREEQGWRYYLLEMDSECPAMSGYIHRRDLSLCYRLEFQVAATHSEAVSNCTQEGGHLLCIDSEKKQDHVQQQLSSSNSTAVDFSHGSKGELGYYIDGQYLNGSWYLSSAGQLMTFNNWKANQASQGQLNHRYVAVVPGENYAWFSVVGSYLRPFICEIDV